MVFVFSCTIKLISCSAFNRQLSLLITHWYLAKACFAFTVTDSNNRAMDLGSMMFPNHSVEKKNREITCEKIRPWESVLIALSACSILAIKWLFLWHLNQVTSTVQLSNHFVVDRSFPWTLLCHSALKRLLLKQVQWWLIRHNKCSFTNNNFSGKIGNFDFLKSLYH